MCPNPASLLIRGAKPKRTISSANWLSLTARVRRRSASAPFQEDRTPTAGPNTFPLPSEIKPITFLSATAPIPLYPAVSPRVHPVSKPGTRTARLAVIRALTSRRTEQPLSNRQSPRHEIKRQQGQHTDTKQVYPEPGAHHIGDVYLPRPEDNGIGRASHQKHKRAAGRKGYGNN